MAQESEWTLELEYFEREDGSKPALEFIRSQPKKMRAKLYWTLDLLGTFGQQLRMPYSEHIDDGIFVLRAKVGHDVTRVFYFFVDSGKAILTHGFYKDTQKEPRPEIERAKKYRSEYYQRQKDSKEA